MHNRHVTSAPVASWLSDVSSQIAWTAQWHCLQKCAPSQVLLRTAHRILCDEAQDYSAGAWLSSISALVLLKLFDKYSGIVFCWTFPKRWRSNASSKSSSSFRRSCSAQKCLIACKFSKTSPHVAGLTVISICSLTCRWDSDSNFLCVISWRIAF